MLEQKSGHWQHFAAQQTPGAGFDVDFAAVDGGGPSLLKRMIRDTIMRCRGSDPTRHSKAFTHLWPDGPVSAQSVKHVGGTPIAFLGAHSSNRSQNPVVPKFKPVRSFGFPVPLSRRLVMPGSWPSKKEISSMIHDDDHARILVVRLDLNPELSGMVDGSINPPC